MRRRTSEEKEILNLEGYVFCHVLKFLKDDNNMNRNNRINLTSTHVSYAVGKVVECENGKVFMNLFENQNYKNFDTMFDANFYKEYGLLNEEEPFTIKGSPLRETLLHHDVHSLEELKYYLMNCGLEFDFMQDIKNSQTFPYYIDEDKAIIRNNKKVKNG